MIFGNLGNISEMMKSVMKLQGDLKKIKDELKNARYEAEVDGVKVVVDGDMEVKELRISGNLDIRKIPDAVKQAVNHALKQAKDDAASKLKSATGGMSIPGLT